MSGLSTALQSIGTIIKFSILEYVILGLIVWTGFEPFIWPILLLINFATIVGDPEIGGPTTLFDQSVRLLTSTSIVILSVLLTVIICDVSQVSPPYEVNVRCEYGLGGMLMAGYLASVFLVSLHLSLTMGLMFMWMVVRLVWAQYFEVQPEFDENS